MRYRLVVAFAAAAVVAAAQADQIAYANLADPPQTYVPWSAAGSMTIDDLHVSGGGQLSALSFAVGSNRWGGPITTDANVLLAVDNGDGVYDAGDAQLLSVPMTSLVAPNPGPQGQLRYAVIDVPLAGVNATVPNNARLWAGVQFTQPARLIVFGPPSAGTTDDSVWVDGQAYSMTDLGFPGTGAGWQVAVTPEPASFAVGVIGLLALRRR